MPPRAVKTIRDLIFWQYAKIIAESAGLLPFGNTLRRKKNWMFASIAAVNGANS